MLINLRLQIDLLMRYLFVHFSFVVLVVLGALALVEDVDELLHPGIDPRSLVLRGDGAVLLLCWWS